MVKQAVQVMARLTGREAQVLRLIARGCTYVQAAAALGISGHTVGGEARSGAAHF